MPATTTRIVLRDRTTELADLLAQVEPDRDLVDVDQPIDHNWPAWRLHTALTSIPWIKRTIAGKLLARKRPRLLPIYDRYVAQVTGCEADHWQPLRRALLADDRALHHRLLRSRDALGLPAEVSALRMLDVICWMEGRDGGKPQS
ncbi:hypothetical protein GSF22_08835 [Micromonospora echinofusca]|uniref:Uncharacterized protein n=1 Tax=Micromonospora echinofusca TaxID=47858 RepID=A0ABS3VNP7_MICEH|nr:hypothetical protein [Micromonospora echinofusca]